MLIFIYYKQISRYQKYSCIYHFYLLHGFLIFSYKYMSKPCLHKLKMMYEDYKKMGIANCTIGKYIVYNQIGRGAFGTVYKGMNDETKKMVAIKVLDLEAVQLGSNERIRQIRRRLCRTQSQLMMLCNSDNVVKCYDVYENKSLKIMVIQFCNGGTLQEEIDKKLRIPEREAILVLKQIINGIAELHSHRIIHRDLKAENILSHNGVYKIADMGFSKVVEENEIKHTTLGTITTMAPEVMKKEPYGLKADIWSIGIIFFQMVFGKVPYRSTNINQMYQEIKSKKLLQAQKVTFNSYTASPEVTKFLKDVLTIDSKKRLGWKELVQHPLFKQNGQQLPNEFRISLLELKLPNVVQYEEKQLPSVEDMIIKFQSQKVEQPQELIRITPAQATIKMKEIANHDTENYSWAKITHHQCLKTQLIYNQIIEKIQLYKLLDLENRNVIEFMYLLCTRCKNNISVINDKLRNDKQGTFLAQNINQTIKKLYLKIDNTWKKYSDKLYDVEGKVLSMVSDRLSRMFFKKTINEKDKFLTGIENMDYNKIEQVKYTDKPYISELVGFLSQTNEIAAKKVKNYLSHYVEINSIQPEDLGNRSFEEYVQMILQ